MTVRRSSYSPNNVLRFLEIFDALVKQLKEKRVSGMFLTKARFPGMKLSTVQNRLSDALKWLRDNANMPDHIAKLSPYRPSYKAEDYELLKLLMRTKVEAEGLRIHLVAGYDPAIFIRDTKGEAGPIQTAADWKVKVDQFLQGIDKVGQITNCSINEADKVWLKNILTPVSIEYYVTGDTLTLLKP